jgi:hypothetical protein
MKTKISYILTLALGLSAGLQAQLIYEPFSQGSGSLDGVAGGTGLNTWSVNQTVDIQSQTLTYGDLENTGGQARATNGTGTDFYVTTTSVLADNNLLDDGATLWASFMWNKASNGGSNEWSGLAFGTDQVDGAFNGINMTSSGNGLGIATRGSGLAVSSWEGGGNASQGSSLSYTLGDSVFVAMRFDWGATAGDVDTITIYTPSTSDLSTLGSSVSKSTSAGIDQTLFDTISFSIRSSGGNTIVDEIRFGATYADVSPIPEPSVFALSMFGFGALWLLRRHSR